MSNSSGGAVGVPLRGLLLAGGLATSLWSGGVLPLFWRMAPVRATVARIIADDGFKPKVLSEALDRMRSTRQSSIEQPEFLQAKALISLRAAEEAMQRKTGEEAGQEGGAAEAEIRNALSTNPADSFLWLMLYSVLITRNGFDTEALPYLSRSYDLGPREGWIALRRNRIALAAFGSLSRQAQEGIVLEFAGMVDSNLLDEATSNLVGIGWANKERLVEGLKRVDLASRQSFAKRVAREGVKVSVPGVDADERPWR